MDCYVEPRETSTDNVDQLQMECHTEPYAGDVESCVEAIQLPADSTGDDDICGKSSQLQIGWLPSADESCVDTVPLPAVPAENAGYTESCVEALPLLEDSTKDADFCGESGQLQIGCLPSDADESCVDAVPLLADSTEVAEICVESSHLQTECFMDHVDVVESNELLPHCPNNTELEPQSSHVPVEMIVSVQKRGRKRIRNPDNWIRNKRKRACQSGEMYVSSRGKVVNARHRLPTPNCNCRYKCSEQVSETARDVAFHGYWSLANKDRQTDFICAHVVKKEKKAHKNRQNRRKNTFQYFLPVEHQCIRVCKDTFLKTLAIGEKTVTIAKMKEFQHGKAHRDMRGRHSPGIKKSASIREKIINHIKSFPTMESHYSRKKTSRQYLKCNQNAPTVC